MPTLTIRPATAADIPALSDLGARTFRETYTPISVPADVDDYADTHFTAEKIAAWLAAPQAVTLLALEDGAPIGYAHVLRDTVPACVADRDAVKLSRLYLLASAQGRGHGKALFEAALGAARTLGAGTVFLGVYDRNLKAIAFYESHGFTTVGTHEFAFGGEIFHDPVMARRLAD